MKRENIDENDNIYIIGTHMENSEYCIKVGYTANMMERLSNSDGYDILHTFYSKNAAKIVREIRSSLKTNTTPVYWYPAEYLNTVLTFINNKI